MFKKILAIVFATVLVLSMSIPAMAAPYVEGGIKISGEKSIVKAVEFDTEDFFEMTYAFHSEYNSSWFNDGTLKVDTAYIFRPEFADGHVGPQTENAEINGENIGALCWTIGTSENMGIKKADGKFWSDMCEWVQYTLNVEVAGKYDIKVWASTDNGNKPINIDISVGGALVGSPQITKVNWSTYNIHDVGTVDLAKGTNVMKLEWPVGDANVAGFEFTLLEAAPTEAPPAEEVNDEGTTAASAGDTEKTGDAENNMILWIVIAAAAVVVIVIIVVLVTKKKK